MSGPSILLINGSPHREGNSMALGRAVCMAVSDAISVERLYELSIAPCRSCGLCACGGECPLTDDMPRLLRLVDAADVLVISSPLHFTSLSAPVIAFYSRLQPFWTGWDAMRSRSNGGRRRFGALAVTAGGSYRNMFSPARSVTAAVFNTLAIDFVGMTTASDTDALPVRENRVALDEAKALGGRLRELCIAAHTDSE